MKLLPNSFLSNVLYDDLVPHRQTSTSQSLCVCRTSPDNVRITVIKNTAFRIVAPGQTNWAFALKRLRSLSAEQIVDAIQLNHKFWDEPKPRPEVSYEAAQIFMMKEISIFSDKLEGRDIPSMTMDSISGLSEGDRGFRDPLRSAIVILAATAILQAAGYTVQGDYADLEEWPEGETDPAFKFA